MQIPPWIQAADPVAATVHGFGLGLQAGSQQAAERFRQQQTIRAQQEDAQHQAQWEAEFGLQTAAAARKAAAIQQYQGRVAQGEDPVRVMMELGPGMGEPGAAIAGAERVVKARAPIPMPQLQTTPKGSEYLVGPDGRPIFAPITRQPGSASQKSTEMTPAQKAANSLAEKKLKWANLNARLLATKDPKEKAEIQQDIDDLFNDPPEETSTEIGDPNAPGSYTRAKGILEGTIPNPAMAPPPTPIAAPRSAKRLKYDPATGTFSQ